MINDEFLTKLRALPARQQVALWVALDKFQKDGGTRFTVAEFAEGASKYFHADDPKELARMMGGIMSSLLRNGMIEQFAGGRKPVWQLVPELHKNGAEYRDALFPVKTYWEEEN